MEATKLDTAAVFERLFGTYRAQFSLFVPAALSVYAAPALIVAIAVEAGSSVLAVVGLGASLLAQVWFQGMVVEAVRDIQDGKRDFTVGTLFRSVAPVVGSLFLASLLAALGIVLGLFLLIIPGLILLTIWAVVAPVVVIERRSPLEALRRSRELVRGSGWRVFGVVAVALILQAVAGQVLGAVIGAIDDGVVGAALGTLISSALVAPITGIAAAVLYLELRRLKGEAPVSGGPAPA
jgi:hypothetical protein